MNILDLKRDDLASALKYAKSKDFNLHPEEWSILFRLQRSVTKLRKLLHEDPQYQELMATANNMREVERLITSRPVSHAELSLICKLQSDGGEEVMAKFGDRVRFSGEANPKSENGDYVFTGTEPSDD